MFTRWSNQIDQNNGLKDGKCFSYLGKVTRGWVLETWTTNTN